MYVWMYICVYACMHACMHVSMYVCMYICMRYLLDRSSWTAAFMYVYMYVCGTSWTVAHRRPRACVHRRPLRDTGVDKMHSRHARGTTNKQKTKSARAKRRRPRQQKHRKPNQQKENPICPASRTTGSSHTQAARARKLLDRSFWTVAPGPQLLDRSSCTVAPGP